MAPTYDSQRLRQLRGLDRRLTADHIRLAKTLALEVVGAAGPDGLIPNTRAAREAIRARFWAVLKDYYVGPGRDALIGPDPQSEFAKLIVDGIADATRLQTERQAALIRRVVRDPEVRAWLLDPKPPTPVGGAPLFADMGTAQNRILVPTQPVPRPAPRGLPGSGRQQDVTGLVQPQGTYEAFHRWVDPNGYRLSDRIWRTGIDVRARLDQLMDYHIGQGTSAVQIARLIEPFLTPAGAATKTQTPYGTSGSYAARRLARTEITAAAGRATANAAACNPLVDRLQWRLSASHPQIDICDDYARGGPHRDGVYPVGQTPPYPAHPHCLCSLLPIPAEDRESLIARLRADIQAAKGDLVAAASGGDPVRAEQLRGRLNPEYLTRAMLRGTLDDDIVAAVEAGRSLRPPTGRTPQLPKPFASEEEAIGWVRRQYGSRDQVLAKLTEPELAGMEAYQNASYHDINEFLRDGEPIGELPRKWLDGMDTAMTKFPAPEDFIAYRGARIPELMEALAAGRDLTGIEFVDRGFASTSLVKEVTLGSAGKQGGGVVMTLWVKKGTRTFPLAALEPAESEILLNRGLRYKVIGQGVYAPAQYPALRYPEVMVEVIDDAAVPAGLPVLGSPLGAAAPVRPDTVVADAAYMKDMTRRQADWRSTLDEEDKATFQKLLGTYSDLQDQARGTWRQANARGQELDRQIERLEDALAAAPVEVERLLVVMGRDMQGRVLEVGDDFYDDGFGVGSLWEASTPRFARRGDNAVFNIRLPSWQRMALMDPLTGKKDWDVVLPRGMNYRITGVSTRRVEGVTMRVYEASWAIAEPLPDSSAVQNLKDPVQLKRWVDRLNYKYWNRTPEEEKLFIALSVQQVMLAAQIQYVQQQAADLAVKRARVAKHPAVANFTQAEGQRVREELLAAADEAVSHYTFLSQLPENANHTLLATFQEAEALFVIPYAQRTPAQHARLEELKKAGFAPEIRSLPIPKARGLLRLPEAERSTVTLTPTNAGAGLDPVLEQRMRDGESFLNNLARRRDFKVNVEIKLIPDKRSYAGRRGLTMDARAGVSTYVHELGHALEDADGAVGQELRRRFYERRTAGDVEEKLADIYPRARYEPHEVTKRDRWDNAYTGKIYGDDASEVISMGLQALFESPITFARSDPDFFDFIVSYLRTDMK